MQNQSAVVETFLWTLDCGSSMHMLKQEAQALILTLLLLLLLLPDCPVNSRNHLMLLLHIFGYLGIAVMLEV